MLKRVDSVDKIDDDSLPVDGSETEFRHIETTLYQILFTELPSTTCKDSEDVMVASNRPQMRSKKTNETRNQVTETGQNRG